MCSNEYQFLLSYASTSQFLLDSLNLHFPNCTDPSLPISPFGQSCCSNAGIQLLGECASEHDRLVIICVSYICIRVSY